MSARLLLVSLLGLSGLLGTAAAQERPGQSEKAIHARLRERVSLTFKDTPLTQVIADLAKLTGLNVVPDTRALHEAGIRLDRPVTLSVNDIPLQSALNLLLKSVRLTYVVGDNVLSITTPTAARGRIRQVVYPIADLVTPHVEPEIDGESAGRPARCDKGKPVPTSEPWGIAVLIGTSPATCDKGKPAPALEAQLMSLIKNTVAKDSWEDVGGPGTMQYFSLGQALVVQQNTDTHEEIAALLSALRRLYDVKVSVELRLVTMPSGLLDPRDFLTPPVSPLVPKLGRQFFLDGKQIERFLAAAQKDRSSEITQAPRITVHNGQRLAVTWQRRERIEADFRVHVRDEEGRLGAEHQLARPVRNGSSEPWQIEVCPVMSADRGSVRLTLTARRGAETEQTLDEVEKGNLGSNDMARVIASTGLRLESKTQVPLGQTLVLHCDEQAPRYADEASQVMYLLITPRIHIRAEEEDPVFLGRP